MMNGTRVFAIANQKGRVGKTTTAINLAAYLADAGRKTLLVDICPNADATVGLGIDTHHGGNSIYEVLVTNAVQTTDAIKADVCPNLSVLPSKVDLWAAELELPYLDEREQRLKDALAQVKDRYDYVLIDCPSWLGLLTINALTAADGVILPLECEYFALEGMQQLIKTIKLVRDRLNPAIVLFGVVLTMYDPRTKLANEIVKDVRSHFAREAFSTMIARNVRLSEAPSFGLTILQHDPRSPGAMAYKALAEEVIARAEESLKDETEETPASAVRARPKSGRMWLWRQRLWRRRKTSTSAEAVTAAEAPAGGSSSSLPSHEMAQAAALADAQATAKLLLLMQRQVMAHDETIDDLIGLLELMMGRAEEATAEHELEPTSTARIETLKAQLARTEGKLAQVLDDFERVADADDKDDASNNQDDDEEPERSTELAQLEERIAALEDKLTGVMDYVEWVVAYLGKKEEEYAKATMPIHAGRKRQPTINLLLKMQTTSGKLTITDDTLTLVQPASPTPKTVTLRRATITHVDEYWNGRPRFGRGGTKTLTIHVRDGSTLELRLLPAAKAQQVLDILRS